MRAIGIAERQDTAREVKLYGKDFTGWGGMLEDNLRRVNKASSDQGKKPTSTRWAV